MTAKLTEEQRQQILALYRIDRRASIELAKSLGVARSYPDALALDRKLRPRGSKRIFRIASAWARAAEVGHVIA